MVDIIKNLTSVNRNVGGNQKKYLVIHYTGNQTDTAKGNSNYFKSVYRGASAHYFVDKDSIYQVVEDNDRAWSVGRNYGKNNLFGTVTNNNSINIEMCSDNGAISEATFKNTVELTRYLMQKHGIPASRVVRHWDVCSKNCPGWNGWGAAGKDASIWNRFKNAIVGNDTGNTTPTPSTPSAPAASTGKINLVHQVMAKTKGWLSEILNFNTQNSNGYSGYLGFPMLAFRAKTKGDASEVGYLEYRAHQKGGNWFGWRRDYNKDSAGDTFAGDGESEIDGLQMRIVGVSGRHVRYRVHVIGIGWLEWITDYGTGDDGYAGIYGYAIDAVQVEIV